MRHTTTLIAACGHHGPIEADRAAAWADSYAEDLLQLRDKRHLDVRALGDLSGFPALCKLIFCICEVMMCTSMLGAVRHANLASLTFYFAHPAPECALMVLQLRQMLKGLGRGNMLKL